MVIRDQVLAAIAAQEQLRGSVPDAVIDVAVAALRAQLEVERPEADTPERRGQATVLFADTAGFTALSERMDAELVARLMNGLWAVVDGAIEQRGGHVDKHIGDAVMGVWGSGGTREDDPERAVRAALDLRDAFQVFASANGLPIAVRIGVNTGPVLFGHVGSSGDERTVTGDAVNVASRVEGLAPHGGVLVAHDTYRHVRGVFDVRPLDPVVVKGKAEPLRTYLVERPKPRAFHLRTRGVEGVETQMLGRDGELGVLQHEFVEATTSRRARVVTIVGEPGAGKSRLLDEFAAWVDLRPEEVLYLKGRSIPDLEIVPRGLLRELFADRFEILDDDRRATVADKLLDGLAPLDARDAHSVGRWLGFDIECDEEVGDLAGSGDFGVIAESLLVRFLRATLQTEPAVMLLEDIHWADGDSLDTICHLVEHLDDLPLLVVAASRPTLDQRRPDWAAGPGTSRRIDLQPLSDADARGLVAEILRFVDDVPDALVDLAVAHSDGNPFYVEELVKTLLEEGVVQVASDGPWAVDLSRLRAVTVPPTLSGVLQARLDALPADERAAVQHASVVGRTFWDDAVATLLSGNEGPDSDDVRPALDRVRRRELVWRNEHSSFSDCTEYRFKHALLRDAAYETVLLRNRGSLHVAAAAWMELRAGERIDEHLAPIAEHLALGGEHGRAAVMFERAAKNASATGGLTTACSLYRRALDSLAQDGDDHGVAATRIRLGLADLLELSGGLSAARLEVERAEQDASALGDDTLLAFALCRLARLSINVGDVREGEVLLQGALPLAEVAGGRVLADVLIAQCWLLDVTEQYEAAVEQSRRALDASRAVGDVVLELRAHISVAVSLSRVDRFDETDPHLEAALALARSVRNPVREAKVLSTKGLVEHMRASARGFNLDLAIEHYTAAASICREHRLDDGMPELHNNLAQAEVESGRVADGVAHAHECLLRSWERGIVPVAAFAVIVIAEGHLAEGDVERGLRMIGTVMADPRSEGNLPEEVSRVLAVYGIDPTMAAPLLADGAEHSLDTLVTQLLRT